MAKPSETYRYVVVESYRESGSGLHGDVHIRPSWWKASLQALGWSVRKA
jgi:hypothetical protein